MERIIGMIGVLLALYVGLTLYTEGAERAFGGLFAFAEEDEAQSVPDGRSPTQRIGDRVQRNFQADIERKERLVGD